MKEWLGILIFVGIAIANIMLEQKRQQKKKAARQASANPEPPSPVRKRPPQRNIANPANEQPSVQKEPTLQEALQTLFENSRRDVARQAPPPLPQKLEVESPQPAKVVQSVRTGNAPAPAPVSPPTPKAEAKTTPEAAPADAATILQTVTNKSRTRNGLLKADLRNKSALRKAIIMSEILSEPKAGSYRNFGKW